MKRGFRFLRCERCRRALTSRDFEIGAARWRSFYTQLIGGPEEYECHVHTDDCEGVPLRRLRDRAMDRQRASMRANP